MRRWGLAKDEFAENGNWPHQLYVRESRRMMGKYVMTEHELLKKRPTPESVGLGSYTMDSHNVQRYITPAGHVQNEGDYRRQHPRPLPGCLWLADSKTRRLRKSVGTRSVYRARISLSASIRMEPVFMILGQSAATAAMLAMDGEMTVQELPYEQLRAQLLADGQVLEFAAPKNAKLGK